MNFWLVIAFVATAYLFVGSIVMLVVNELLDGCVTRPEFVVGMVVYPRLLFGMAREWVRSRS